MYGLFGRTLIAKKLYQEYSKLTTNSVCVTLYKMIIPVIYQLTPEIRKSRQNQDAHLKGVLVDDW